MSLRLRLALLFALVLSGPVEGLHKHRVPRSVSAFVILAVALGILGGAMTLLWTPAQSLYDEAPATIRRSLCAQMLKDGARSRSSPRGQSRFFERQYGLFNI